MRPAAPTIWIPPYLDLEVIRAAADAALQKARWDGIGPVDVEKLLDARLGIDIVVVPDLKDRTDSECEGFLSRDCTTIYVHQETHDRLQNRLRFTLAHEWAHLELHRPLHDQAPDFGSFEAWRRYVNGMPEKVRFRYEWQANMFAGFVLAPRAQLQAALRVAERRVRGPFAEVMLSEEEDRAAIVGEVARRLQVSGEVIERRGRTEGWW